MFSYSPDRYMVAVLRLIKEAQGTERDKAEGNKSKPRVGRCVCASVPGEIFICFWPCVFFTWGLKFGLITTWDVEGELGFSPGAGAAMSIQELSLLPTSCPLPNSQGAGNHAKSPCREQFFLGSLSMVNKRVGFDGAGAVFWFPALHSCRSLGSPGTGWEVWGEPDQTPRLQALKPHAASSDLPRFPQTRNSLLV